MDVGSAPITDNVPLPSKLSVDPEPLVDAPLDSGSDDDFEGDGSSANAGGEMDDYSDAEDMFADD